MNPSSLLLLFPRNRHFHTFQSLLLVSISITKTSSFNTTTRNSTTGSTNPSTTKQAQNSPDPVPKPILQTPSGPSPMPICRGIDIEDVPVSRLQRYLADGKFSGRDLVECYLERIRGVNSVLRAVVEVNPDALDIAEKLDRERESGRIRSPLHGIPFFVKDNMATKDKMETTAGSTMLIGAKVPKDAYVVSLLRDAGAVLLGHTNMSEWASMRSSYYAEGYSSRGGQCRNPYNLALHPGGSSGGSAVAVASNMCVFSLGTETDSSVIHPSDRNGVVGIKPTVGLISSQGIMPEASSLDTVGTMGRTVEDAAIALDGISGSFNTTTTTATTSGTIDPDPTNQPKPPYKSFISGKDALKGARFGLPWKRIWEAATQDQDESMKVQYPALRAVIQRIKDAGGEVVEGINMPSAEEIIPPREVGWDWEYPEDHPEKSEFTIVKTEFYNEIKTYLENLTTNPQNINNLEDIVAYNVKHTDKEGGQPNTHPAFPLGQDNFEKSLASKGIKDDTYWRALRYIRQKSREEGIDAAFSWGDSRLDGLLVPVQTDTGVGCQLAAKAGYPIITIPVGVGQQGIPFGIGIIQTAWNEHLLVKYGSALEDLIQGRTRPGFRNVHADNYMYVGSEPK